MAVLERKAAGSPAGPLGGSAPSASAPSAQQQRRCMSAYGRASPWWAQTAVAVALLLAGTALLQPIYAQGRTLVQAVNTRQQQQQQPAQNAKVAFLPQHAWHRANILLFGDSLTELAAQPDGGWGVLLADRYKRRADIINRGFGGYTSKQAVEILPELGQSLDLGKTALAVVWFGTNDAVNTKGPQSFMQVSVDNYISNLKKIVSTLKGAGVANVMLVTPPPVDDAKRASTTPGYPPDRKFDLAKQYANAAVKAGQEAGVPVLNVFEQMQSMAPNKAWSDRFLQPDGLHFSPTGQRAFYKMLNDFVWSNFQSARPDELPFHHLSWEGLDYGKSASQFTDEEKETKKKAAKRA